MNAPPQVDALPLPPSTLLDDASLFIDFDGTLVELAEQPDAVKVGAPVRSLVQALHDRYAGRFAIVSGRSIAQLESMLGPVLREMTLACSHGSEQRWAGSTHAPVRAPELDAVAARFHAFARNHPGTTVEEKSFGVALHYRQAPAAETEAQILGADLAREFDLYLQKGKMVVELRPAGADKGTAIHQLMARPPMLGTRPVFLGDDITDEAGFAAVHALGGAGILVGSPRPTAATYRLADPAAVRAWLGEAVA